MSRRDCSSNSSFPWAGPVNNSRPAGGYSPRPQSGDPADQPPRQYTLPPSRNVPRPGPGGAMEQMEREARMFQGAREQMRREMEQLRRRLPPPPIELRAPREERRPAAEQPPRRREGGRR